MSHSDTNTTIQVAGKHRGATVAIIWICLAVALSLMLFSINRGLGLTDEAFYVAWIADPARYDATIQTFGLPLHLVFVALGRSLIALRIFGIMLLLVSGGALGRSLARYYRSHGRALPMLELTALGALFGLSYYALWILTPSYNLLANAGGALVLAGALEWDIADQRNAPRRFGQAAALIGIGGFLSFFGKPPLAAAEIVGVAMLAWRSIRRHGFAATMPALATTAAFCLVPMTASIHLSVGFGAFAQSLSEGTKVLKFGNSLLAIPAKAWREFFQEPILAMSTTIIILALALPNAGEVDWKKSRRLHIGFMLLITFVMLYSARLLLGGLRSDLLPWSFIGLPVACAALSFLTLSIVKNTQPSSPTGAILPFVALLILPFATATGTANHLINQIGASIYPFLFVLVVAGWFYWNVGVARAIEVATALFMVSVLLCSIFRPYGLAGSVLDQTEPVRLNFTRDTLLMTPEAKAYADALARLAADGGLAPSTPVIDLSSGGPGTAVLLGGRTPFFPWLLPNTDVPGLIAQRAWQTLDDQQKYLAWIVGPIEPKLTGTAPARWLLEHRRCYRASNLLYKTFWQQQQVIIIWIPTSATCFDGSLGR